MDFFSEYITPFLLAVLQGVTEFLPVSSSGHLVLLNAAFPVDAGILFDLVLHLATLVSIVLFYRRDIASICVGCVREFRTPEKTNLKFVGYLMVATVLTGGIGLFLNDYVETHLRNVVVVGCLLIVNAVILWASRKRGLFGLSTGALNLKTAVVLGLAQGVAVLPGISRSGSTITAALLMGIEPGSCARISFLLSIPVILGALVLHIPDMANLTVQHGAIVVAAALLAAAVGYFSLLFLDRILKKANFHHFAPYCVGVGLLAIVLGLVF